MTTVAIDSEILERRAETGLGLDTALLCPLECARDPVEERGDVAYIGIGFVDRRHEQRPSDRPGIGVRSLGQPAQLQHVFAIEGDGRAWVHMSLAGRDRLPTWQQLVDTKRWAIGDVYAYQVFPPAAKHVNIHPYALHLWAPLDGGGQPLPDFTQGGDSI